MTTWRRHALTAGAALGGAVLFVYAVRRAGVAEIVDGIRKVGWGLVPILAIAGARFLIRACSWRLCMTPEMRLPLGQTFRAFLAGDAVGNITPLGVAASEPTKFFLTRHRLATHEAIASLAIDNLFYAASIVAVLIFSVIVMLLTVPLPLEWREGAAVALLVAAVAVAVAVRLLRGTWRGDGQRPAWRETLASLRRSVLSFAATQPGRPLQVFLLDLSFHALAIIEVFMTLRWLLGDRSPTFSQAIVFEALNRVVTVAFKFVPFRVGIDEALSGALAPMLAVQPAAGVTLAVVRKVRNLFWTGVGLALIAGRPDRAAPATGLPESEPGHRT